MRFICYKKQVLFWLWIYCVAFVFGAWLVIRSVGKEPFIEDIELIDQDGWLPGTNPDAEFNPPITVEPGPTGAPVIAIDILKAFGNGEVRRAWSEAGEFRLRMPIDLIQAMVRTAYEPIKETAGYATQSKLHFAGTLCTAFVATRAVQGKLDDDIDDVVDLFDSSSDDGDSFDKTPLSSSSLEASGKNSSIEIRDGAQGPFNATATDGGKIFVDFQSSD